jgi:hypothetical protein
MDSDGPQAVGRPVFRVVRGDASAEEIAAVVTALAAVAGAGRAAAPGPHSPRRLRAWADRAAMLRKPLRPGPEGWRASARPT